MTQVNDQAVSAETEADQSTETTFVESLQGFASFCEACIRDGKMMPDDIELVIGKLRDAAFVVDQLTKLRDDLRAQLTDARAEIEKLRDQLADVVDEIPGLLDRERARTALDSATAFLARQEKGE